MTRDEIEHALAITREAELPEFSAQHPALASAFANPAVVDLVINELPSELLRATTGQTSSRPPPLLQPVSRAQDRRPHTSSRKPDHVCTRR